MADFQSVVKGSIPLFRIKVFQYKEVITLVEINKKYIVQEKIPEENQWKDIIELDDYSLIMAWYKGIKNANKENSDNFRLVKNLEKDSRHKLMESLLEIRR